LEPPVRRALAEIGFEISGNQLKRRGLADALEEMQEEKEDEEDEKDEEKGEDN
jgi:hypothetical protein